MKALILAGGFARRLAPITDFIAKPLLPIGGRPIIDWILDNVKEVPNVDTIIVSTNSYYESQFKYWLKCRAGENIELLIEPTTREEEKFGAIAGMKYAMERFGDDDYLVVAGDNYFDFSLTEFVSFFTQKKAPCIAVYDVQSRDKAKRYGVVTIDSDNRIVDLIEKPEYPESTLVSTACYVFPKGTVNLIKNYLENKNNPDSPGYFISWLVKNNEVYGYPFSGLWLDIGNIDEYRRAFDLFQ